MIRPSYVVCTVSNAHECTYTSKLLSSKIQEYVAFTM